MNPFPNVEAILIRHLLDDDAVSALVGDRVASKTPTDTDTQGWVKVSLIDAGDDPETPVDYLWSGTVQIDCTAGAEPAMQQEEAFEIGQAVVAALATDRLPPEIVRCNRRLQHIPDPTFTGEGERERYIVQASITARLQSEVS